MPFFVKSPTISRQNKIKDKNRIYFTKNICKIWEKCGLIQKLNDAIMFSDEIKIFNFKFEITLRHTE